MAHKAMRARYYWSSMQKDVAFLAQRCDRCQWFWDILRKPVEELTLMIGPWPFAQWGIDIVGSLLRGRRQMRFLVVAIDYFTKWVEDEALAKITERNIQDFTWSSIINWFGILRYQEFCVGLGIKNHYSSPAHPEANGQVEVTNKTLIGTIKKRLEGSKGLWPEELPSVLWAYRTTTRAPTRETPFSLAFGPRQ